MPLSPTASSTLTFVAVAVLAFDGVAIAALGYMTGRMMLVPVGLVFFVSSALLLVYRRWHHRRLEDIVAARRELSEEAHALRGIVSGKRQT